MENTFKECVLRNFWFKMLSSVSILLIIISFFLPPQGVIDPSVIAASGEIIGWGALYSVILAIQKGKSISMKHGETEITVNGKRYKLEESQPEVEEENYEEA